MIINDVFDLPIISLIEGVYSHLNNDNVFWSMHPYEFASLLEECKNYTDTNCFFEVGSGIGFNLMIANHMGFNTSGIEIDEKLYNFSTKKMKLSNIINGDIFNLNSIGQSIVFCNKISTDDFLSNKSENHVINICDKGSIIVFPNPTTQLRYNGNNNLKKIKDKIYLKL
jgi:hypothetical protein